jgi:NADPH:quinone reductase-like Zn-dependent oxidoreductase
MRAVQYAEFGGPEVLEVADVPEPHAEPSQIRVAVRAVGVNPIDWKVRSGAMGGGDLPRGTGVEAAGVVDEVGDGVTGVSKGDRVFGSAANAAAEFAVMSHFAPIPASLDFTGAAALPVAVETATRCLDLLGVADGQTLLINGASGGVGLAAVQLARARGARVIGSGGPRSQDRLREFGAEPVVYGDVMADQVRALAPDGVDRAIDMALSGGIATLSELAGGADNVVAIADFQGAQEHGVRFTGGGDEPRAWHGWRQVAELIEAGQFSLPVAHVLPLSQIAEAHRLSESGHAGGKIVLTVD